MHHHLSTFKWDTNIGEFLFPGLNVNGIQALILLSLVLVGISVAYEAIKVHQTKIRARAARERLRSTSCNPSENANLLTTNQNTTILNEENYSKKFFKLFSQALIFLLHTTIGYIIMLSVMVYNIYIFIAVIFGMGLGYFLFGHISMKINMENIRAKTTNAICSTKFSNEPSVSESQLTGTTGYINEVAISSSDEDVIRTNNF